MRFFLGGLVLLMNTLDNATTFVCLRAPVDGFEVVEANPLARWLFDAVGLVHGLMLESLMTVAAVGFLVLTQTLPSEVRTALLLVLSVLPAWAVANNLSVMAAIGVGV